MNKSKWTLGIIIWFLGLLCSLNQAAAAAFSITKADWNGSALSVSGTGTSKLSVSISEADTGTVLGRSPVSNKSTWGKTIRNPASVPCTILAEQSNGESATRDVANRPASCDNPPPPPTRPNVSINSSSQNRPTIPVTPVPEWPRTGSPAYQVLAVNDLGMHCGDLDARISSILPPFNVLHAQVVKKGSSGANRPVRLGDDQVTLRYSAAANPNDPVLANPGSILDGTFSGVYKTNFWDVARGAYDAFYPPGILPFFYPLGANILDWSLPVPDVERLYLLDGQLAATQQTMPGVLTPYDSAYGNTPQSFSLFVGTQPFFTSFVFGYTAPVSWFEAAGIPITTFDDAGRENAYPLMRVQAVAKEGNTLGEAAGTVLASLDTVIPVSGEADCKACHAATGDGGNGSAVARLASPVVSIEDPKHGQVPQPVSVEWATDKNILKLHDVKNGTHLISGTTEDFPTQGATAFKPVVCQTCHYSPALDLAHVGPNDVNGQQLFPDMPPPVGRSLATARDVLQQTCYQCHPGKRTQCLRGAMGQAGVVCQDCHGNMAQVGDDFSRNQPGGGFLLSADFYSNPNTPRVPWANQPGCGSCHTGDAFNNLPADGVYKAADNIRLLQAWKVGDAKATPIVPVNKRFAENVVTAAENAAAAGNPKLYRVSTGHGGLFCQACHGSTHAEWSSNPLRPEANDNLAAIQLQGHAGTIMECRTCHTAYTGHNLNGPHGMHPVADTDWILRHHEITQTTAQKNACRACHGKNGEGTVLSRMPVARTLTFDSKTAVYSKGEQVNCTKWQSNKL